MPTLEPVPAFEDNYIWTVHDGRSALLVDPGEAKAILTWLATRRMQPAAVLLTHRHADHVGGVAEIRRRHPGIAVYGPADARLPDVTVAVGEGDVVVALGMRFHVLAVPGHTLEHIAYVGHGWLFCGDTMFSCGCGKVFEGSSDLLHASLQRLAALPTDTLVCCAHEYTLDNIRFALTVEPDNAALLDWREHALALRRAGRPTLPTRLADELACNPFLRCAEPALQRRLAGPRGGGGFVDAAATFAVLRSLKDAFG
ncbi:MAG: hydroxyacylglutathione hydrolase [Gallionellaceae bacterium]|nr:hydroxyacylglutathione hydrolase [Gallionellaceae bacterium]